MDRYQIKIPLPSQGLNLADDSLIGDNEAAKGTYNICFRNGTPACRGGTVDYAALPSFPAKITKLYAFTDNESVEHFIACTEDTVAEQGKMYRLVDGAWTLAIDHMNSKRPALLEAAFATATYTFSQKVLVMDGEDYRLVDGVTAHDVDYYTPSADEIAAYGTNVLLTNPAEITCHTFLINDDNRLWAAGCGTAGQDAKLIHIGHLGIGGPMPDYWPSTQTLKMREPVTGMARYMGDVIVFTEHTTTLFTGSTPNTAYADTYQRVELPVGFGCSNHETIALGDGAIYWANSLGVYRYKYVPTGFSVPECVSEFTVDNGDGTMHTRTIKSLILGISDWTQVFGVFCNHEYRIHLGDGTLLVFDTVASSWAYYEYADDLGCAMPYEGMLLYGSGVRNATNLAVFMEADRIYNAEQSGKKGLTDSGQPVSFQLIGKFFDFEKAANKKRFKKLYVSIYSELVSYDIDVTCNVDNELTVYESAITNYTSRWGEILFGEILNTRRTNLNYQIKVRHRGKRYNFQYQLKSTSLILNTAAWTLLDLVLLMKMRELK
jgi:hypothetical protein